MASKSCDHTEPSALYVPVVNVMFAVTGMPVSPVTVAGTFKVYCVSDANRSWYKVTTVLFCDNT